MRKKKSEKIVSKLTKFRVTDPENSRVYAVVEAQNEDEASARCSLIARAVGMSFYGDGIFMNFFIHADDEPMVAPYYSDLYFLLRESPMRH